MRFIRFRKPELRSRVHPHFHSARDVPVRLQIPRLDDRHDSRRGPKVGGAQGSEKMITISKSREIRASVDRVWEIISDIDNEPKYYEGLTSVKNLSRRGNVTEREVVVGHLNHESRQTVVLNPTRSVEVKMTKGPIIGTRLTTLKAMTGSKTRVGVSWN